MPVHPPLPPILLTININSVTPPNALENQETIVVDGTVTNVSGVAMNGELRLNDNFNGTAFNLSADSTPKAFKIQGAAPSAGGPVSVSYVRSGQTAAISYASDPYNARARFELAISKFRVNIRRHALFDDVIQATAVAQFAGNFLGDPDDPHSAEPQNRYAFLGTVSPGVDVPATGDVFRFMTFDTTMDGAQELLFSYVFQDLGPAALALPKEILNVVSSGAASVLGSLYAGSGAAWSKVDAGMQTLHDQMYSQCGASIAISSQRYTSSELISLTNDNGVIAVSRTDFPRDVQVFYPCQVGQYTASYQIRRSSWVRQTGPIS